MNTKHFLAFDLGATSGRSVLGSISNGIITLKELTRFPNKMLQMREGYYWNIYSLFEALKQGLVAAADENKDVAALGIDTWGVDFVYLGDDGNLLGLPRAYRDPYTHGMPEKYFNLVSRREVYELTGIQIMDFNSLYQLYAAQQENSSALRAASNILFIPDALSYLLTNQKVCEYTIASTAQIMNPRTQQIENKLLETIGIDPQLFPPIIQSGEIIGTLTAALAEESGLGEIPVVAVAGHDTGSAIVAIPAENERFAYLSSGTWSLMGIELQAPIISNTTFEMNFTNEGGVDGTTRLLKNIAGMWLLEQCMKEWKKDHLSYTYPQLIALAQDAAAFQSLVDPDHPSFANPSSMLDAITNYCMQTKQAIPSSHGAFVRCIFESLALKYKLVLNHLQNLAPFVIEKLHIIGGGAQNKLLNQFTANSINLPVVAGPIEATAMGNIMMQAKAIGLVKDIQAMRNIIKASVELEEYLPQEVETWETAYSNYINIISSYHL